MTLLDYTITGRTSSSHCGPLIKTERGDRQLQSGHWLRYSAAVIFNFWRKRKHLSSTRSHRNASSRKSIASRCRTISIYKIFRHYRLDFLVKQTSFQDNFCWVNSFNDFDRSEGLIKGLPLQWTLDTIHSGKSCLSKYKVVQQNPIIREFWSFPSRNPVAFGLCLPRTQGKNVEIRLCDLIDWRVTHPAKFHPVFRSIF